jgi:hypothetical protein
MNPGEVERNRKWFGLLEGYLEPLAPPTKGDMSLKGDRPFALESWLLPEL